MRSLSNFVKNCFVEYIVVLLKKKEREKCARFHAPWLGAFNWKAPCKMMFTVLMNTEHILSVVDMVAFYWGLSQLLAVSTLQSDLYISNEYWIYHVIMVLIFMLCCQIICTVKKHILTGGPKRLPFTIPPLIYNALKVLFFLRLILIFLCSLMYIHPSSI